MPHAGQTWGPRSTRRETTGIGGQITCINFVAPKFLSMLKFLTAGSRAQKQKAKGALTPHNRWKTFNSCHQLSSVKFSWQKCKDASEQSEYGLSTQNCGWQVCGCLETKDLSHIDDALLSAYYETNSLQWLRGVCRLSILSRVRATWIKYATLDKVCTVWIFDIWFDAVASSTWLTGNSSTWRGWGLCFAAWSKFLWMNLFLCTQLSKICHSKMTLGLGQGEETPS